VETVNVFGRARGDQLDRKNRRMPTASWPWLGCAMRKSGQGRAGSCLPSPTAMWTRLSPNCDRWPRVGQANHRAAYWKAIADQPDTVREGLSFMRRCGRTGDRSCRRTRSIGPPSETGAGSVATSVATPQGRGGTVGAARQTTTDFVSIGEAAPRVPPTQKGRMTQSGQSLLTSGCRSLMAAFHQSEAASARVGNKKQARAWRR
jgi:hypothetical protein